MNFHPSRSKTFGEPVYKYKKKKKLNFHSCKIENKSLVLKAKKEQSLSKTLIIGHRDRFQLAFREHCTLIIPRT